MNTAKHTAAALFLGLASMISAAHAGVCTTAIRAITTTAVKKGGTETAEQAVRTALRSSGDAGVHKIVSEYGEDAVVHLCSSPARTRIVTEIGEDGAKALLRHRGLAEDLLRLSPGREAASALAGMSRKEARCLHKLAKEGLMNRNNSSAIITFAKKYPVTSGIIATLGAYKIYHWISAPSASGGASAAMLILDHPIASIFLLVAICALAYVLVRKLWRRAFR